jgi:hypothetical protein
MVGKLVVRLKDRWHGFFELICMGGVRGSTVFAGRHKETVASE